MKVHIEGIGCHVDWSIYQCLKMWSIASSKTWLLHYLECDMSHGSFIMVSVIWAMDGMQSVFDKSDCIWIGLETTSSPSSFGQLPKFMEINKSSFGFKYLHLA